MRDANKLLERAGYYRLLIRSVADDLAIHAMSAMAEDLEKQAEQLTRGVKPRSPEPANFMPDQAEGGATEIFGSC